MPLRDHFHVPLETITSWEELHGGWPMMIVADLFTKLPPPYVAGPRVHLGAEFEVDVSAFEKDEPGRGAQDADVGEDGLATVVWSPPKPTLNVASDLPDQDEYEVRIYDTKRRRRLVAAIELVSPANKDRPETRGSFVSRCLALLQQGVSVAIVDVVTVRHANLYGELLDLIGQEDESLAPEPPPIYAAACRWTRKEDAWYFRAWAHVLTLGQTLPTLPLWLADDLAIPLDLEVSYEETCRLLHIA
jgi:hypothetical protein